MYWLIISAFLIIQVAEFSNQNIRALKFAHIYLIPIALIVLLIASNTPEHMEVVMTVVCFLIWWIYRKHMVARLYSQDMSRKDVLNMRRLNIWLSSQILATLTYHLLKLIIMLAIKSSVMDDNRQVYYTFWKDEMFKGLLVLVTYANAILFSWSTINFIKSDSASNAETSTLPVFVGGNLQLESYSRRPSVISGLSMNNVAPLTPRDPNMLHI
ncbi:unnamed protein product [Caenorhabditis sp. 36 PRJEB53466]|nr:unnamed protein product [Caenorhabditis sp. 36 PRJEB53466]